MIYYVLYVMIFYEFKIECSIYFNFACFFQKLSCTFHQNFLDSCILFIFTVLCHKSQQFLIDAFIYHSHYVYGRYKVSNPIVGVK